MNPDKVRVALLASASLLVPLLAAAEFDGIDFASPAGLFTGNPKDDDDAQEEADKKKAAVKTPAVGATKPVTPAPAPKPRAKQAPKPAVKPAPAASVESAPDCAAIKKGLEPVKTAAAIEDPKKVDALAQVLADCLYQDPQEGADQRAALKSHLAEDADGKRPLARQFINDVAQGFPGVADEWHKKALLGAGQTFAKGGTVPKFPEKLKPSALQLYCKSLPDAAAAPAKEDDCGVVDSSGGAVLDGNGRRVLAQACAESKSLTSDAEHKLSAAADPAAATIAKNCGEAKAAAALTGAPRKPVGDLTGTVPAPPGDKAASGEKKDASFLDKYGKAAGIGAGVAAGLILAAVLGTGPLGLLVAALAGGVGANALMNRSSQSPAPVAAVEANDKTGKTP